ncbi:MAG: phosphoglycolate phosphatase [Glaciecola sp.]|jgi:phosphoglycolate phosphatase
MKFDYIIFDWDGTVMDSAAKIVSCMQKAAKQGDIQIPSAKQVEHIIGISLHPAIKQLFSVDDEKANELVKYYKNIFLEHDQTPCPLFDNAFQTLSHMQQRARLAVATGKARRGLERAWKGTGTKHFFEISRCADEAESKPSSDMLLQLIKEWNIEPEQALMVGDTVYDMQMAERIGMPRIGVSYGVHDRNALLNHSPIAIIDDFSEMSAFVK